MCRLVPINRDFFEPAERVRLMTCQLIGDYSDREFDLYYIQRGTLLRNPFGESKAGKGNLGVHKGRCAAKAADLQVQQNES